MMWQGFGLGLNSWVAVLMIGFFGLLVATGVVLFIVWLFMRSAQNGGDGEPEWCRTAQRRYASGEISREQYEEICRTIRST